jgi:hypothetical protein
MRSVVYAWLLRLYPADYRRFFGAAMLDVFERRGREQRATAFTRYAAFLAREVAAIAAGAAREWLAKLTSPPLFRARHLRDLRLMRPPGASKRDWYAGL